MTRAEYERYLQSQEWRDRRTFVLARAGHACEKCGEKKRLAIHHLHYESLGEEPLEALQALCPRCHSQADRARQSEQNTAYGNGVDTYMTKKYGEEWDLEILWDDAEQEFDAWLETQEDHDEYHDEY